MLHPKGTDKATYYLDLLDTARCNGHWSEVPELVRKVGKHAPHRKCLHLTAQAEYQEAIGSTGLQQIIPRLLSASQEATAYPEDVFQARICLGSLHWTLNEPEPALQTIPENVLEAYRTMAKGVGMGSGWSSVCAVKGAYIRGELQEKASRIDDALRTYSAILPHIENNLATGCSPEFRLWSEKLLAQHCVLSNRIIKAQSAGGQEPTLTNAALAPFRVWADLWASGSKLQSVGASTHSAKDRGAPRRRVWQVYYDTLSAILQKGQPYPAVTQRSSLSANEVSADNVKSMDNPNLHQSIELRRVEAIYEDILLRDVSFPKANETNVEVESWADQVVANWRILSSPQWLEEDLGSGGKEAVTRAVLAILYRAATRTFHSTRILRHLFTLHTALAEFMLAGKAFDTYIELVSKGKARVEKSGEDEVGLDDDGTVLRTTAAGLQMLCCYGRRKEVERAQDIALVLEKWLEKIQSPWEPVASAEDEPTDLRGERSRPDQQVSGEAIAAAHHSLGVCRAHWARLTFETSSRPELQAKAIASFRAALESTSTAIQSAEIHFALASILAETREIGAAIECAKKAIALYASDREAPTLKNQVHADTLWEERCKRGLFKAWHLLSFLLSARQDFANAIAACDAANELYNELFESAGRREAVERLALSERQSIIELKMSQLVLWEILDGPEEAVNACGDLLGAYKQFFVSDGAAPTRGPTVNLYSSKDTISPPQTANGTVRRSLLGRSKVALPSLPRLGHHSNQTPIAGEATPGVSRDTNIPSTLDGSTSPRKYQPPQHLARQESKKLHKRRSRKSMLSEHRTRGESSHGSSQANGSEEFGQALPLRFANVKRSSIEASHNGSSLDRAPDGLNVPITHNAPLIQKSGQAEPQRLPPTTSISTHHRNQNPSPEYPKPPTSAASKPSPIASQSSYPLPEPLYSSSDLNRHSLTLLARIWLLIARLYRDAGMPVDAQGAVSEASNQARLIEAAVTAQDSSAEALSMPGWGKLKSVAEVWADVHAEQASLCLYNRNQSGASEEFEKALGWFPDHNAATVGLSNMLLDYYDDDPAIKAAPPSTAPSPSKPMLASLPVRKTPGGGTDEPITANSEASSALLSRLASRDRAYGLLSMLTKSGRGWDDSEAWSALARVYEQSGQIDKAKEALWWVVELEDSRPLREWSCIGEL